MGIYKKYTTPEYGFRKKWGLHNLIFYVYALFNNVGAE